MPLGQTQIALAAHLGVSIQRIHELVRGRRGVTPETAWLLSQALDTTPEFCLNLQVGYEAEAEDAPDKHPVTPGAVLPARDLYGDMLFETGRFEEALEAYETTLGHSSNRFYSLAGAGMAAAKAKQRDQAMRHYSRLLEIAGEGDSSRKVGG